MDGIEKINWKFVKDVSNVNIKDGTVSINYIDGQKIIESVPLKLMRALISRGEQNFIDQDIERFK